MALSLADFSKRLAESGVMSADEIKAAWNALPPDARPKDGDAFAKLLVERGKLTDFQSRQILAGRGRTLVMGDYVVLAAIGAGGMGQVYKARHRRMDRVVALKVMSAAAMKDEAAVKRFQREVKAAARLEHPNIVTAYDSGEAGDVKYLVMQFVDGGDLSSLVKREGPLAIEQAVDFVIQAARGLAYAHGEGVIHRDIKPANLLLDKKGVVKILDMGLARFEDGGDGLTATEQVMGTVDYMSPEQASHTKTADARSDVYSLGCTLWYLLTGKKAYEGDTLIERLMAHREAPLPSLVKTRDDASWPLEQVLHKMLAKRPADRYQTMDEVVAALEPFGGGSSVLPGAAGKGSSIGMGSAAAHDPELASFLQSMGSKTQATSATSGKPSPKSTTVAPVEATAALRKPDVDTDPKSEMHLPSAGRSAPTGRDAKPAAVGGHGKKTPTKLIAAGVGGFAVLMLLGVWVYVKNQKGEIVAAVQVPEAGSVEVATEPTAASGTTSLAAGGSSEAGLASFLPGAPTPAGPPAVYVPAGPTVDLLQFVDPTKGGTDNKDRPRWRWTDPRRVLTADTSNSDTRIPIDFQVPEAYVLEGRIIPQSEGRRRNVAIGLRQGAQRFWFDIDRTYNGNQEDPGPWSGLWVVDGLPPGRHEASVKGEHLSVGRALAVRIEVRPDGVFAQFDGKPVVEFRGPMNRLSLGTRDDVFAGLGDLWLATHERTNFESLTLTPLKPSPSAARPTPSATVPAAAPPPGHYALEFDGAGGCVVDTLTADLKTPLTIEGYFQRTDQYKDRGKLPMLGFIRRFALHLNPHSGRPALSVGHHQNLEFPYFQLSSEQDVPTNRAVHWAAVWSPTKVLLFVDGKLVASRDEKLPTTSPPLRAIVVGQDFVGRADEIRVSQTARYDRDFTPPARHEPDPDTLLLYHCDEGTGNVLRDASGHGHHVPFSGAKYVLADAATIAPQPSASASGTAAGGLPQNLALRFDPKVVDRPVLTPLRPVLGPDQGFTLEAYVLIESDDGSPNFQLFGIPSLVMFSRKGDKRFSAFLGGTKEIHSTIALHADHPTHVALVRKGTEARLFVDGKLAGQASDVPPQSDDKRGLQIGNPQITGLFDEIRCSKVARYEQDFTPARRFEPDADTLALYHCDEGRGDQLFDSSGNDQHGTVSGATWTPAGAVPIAQPPADAAGKTIDLLPAIDVGRDAVAGDWSRTADGIVVKNNSTPAGDDDWAALQLPYVPPEEYDFEIEFTTTGGKGHVVQTLAAEGRAFNWTLDVGLSVGKKAGFGRIDGVSVHDRKDGTTLKPQLLVPGKRHRSRVEVRRGVIRGFLDDEKLVEWGGDFKRLDLEPKYRLRDAGRLGIGTYDRAVTFHKITVREVTGAGSPVGAPAAQSVPTDETGAKAWETPSFRQWVKDVQALPAEQQIEAVRKKLVELNPKFNGTFLGADGGDPPKIENGVVTRLVLSTKDVTELSPLRALTGLNSLHCAGAGSSRTLTDLSPLQGMPLNTLNCALSSVSDLSPLTGMPLTSLRCSYSQISDLAPLRGMPLQTLWCENTLVSDLSPLETCKDLTRLFITNTKVTAAGVAALQKALPNCKIEWDDPAKPTTPGSSK